MASGWTIIAIFALVSSSQAAHILFFHNLASYSHRVTTYPLADALAKRGHQVTFMNPFHHRGPYINPNITEIVPRSVERYIKAWLSEDFDINHRVHDTFKPLLSTVFQPARESCQEYFNSPELAEFYNRTNSLDLVIMDNCLADCAVAIAYKYGAKHIVFNTVLHIPYEYDRWGFLPDSSANPELEAKPFTPPMSFWERVQNTLLSLRFRWEHYKFTGQLDTMARKHLKDPKMPAIDDLMRNASLVFYTGDVISDQARSHAPFIVNIGGIYCKPVTDPLPSELAEFIDSPNSEGFVYISLGSLAISSNLPDSTIQVFMETIRRLPELRFVWKWDSPVPADKPANLFLKKWMPQTDILAHPKLRAFVTQCGRPSTLEALCNAVPMVAFPVLGDQDNNANRMNEMGANVKLELSTVSTEEFVSALTAVALNPKMKERLVELRAILLDRPLTALETSVWWTEYVLRHKDTSFLRPAAHNQWWYERRLLDVWAFLFTMVLTAVFMVAAALTLFVKGALAFMKSGEDSGGKVKVN